MKYAHENGCRWNEDTCTNAAKKGHFDCLQYAREHGCPWNDKTPSGAAYGGHMDCLQYIFEQESQERWKHSPCICLDAIYGGKVSSLKYVVPKLHLLKQDLFALLWIASSYSQEDCFKFIYQRCVDLLYPVQEWWQHPINLEEYIQDLSWLLHVNQLLYTIDLDDGWWRKQLFNLQLDTHRYLLERVNQKKIDIQVLQKACEVEINGHIVSDVLQHIVYAYF